MQRQRTDLRVKGRKGTEPCTSSSGRDQGALVKRTMSRSCDNAGYGMTVRTCDAQRANELIDQINLQVRHLHALRVIPFVASTRQFCQLPGYTLRVTSAHRSQAIITRSSSYFVLHTQYSLSSSILWSSSPAAGSSASAFESPSGPVDPRGITDVEREREALAEIDFFTAGGTAVAARVAPFAAFAVRPELGPSELTFDFVFGTGFARGFGGGFALGAD
jgi:hypothetical protein